MSRDSDGKPPNPFAPPGGAANPFDDIMGGAAAPAPNPFAQVASSSPSNAAPDADEPPAITVIKASERDAAAATAASPAPPAGGHAAMEALGLDVEERPPPPKQKTVRPELEEWRSEMAHGAAAPTSEPPNLASVSNPRMQALPAKKGGALKVVAIAVGIVVVLAVAGIAQRVLTGGGKDDGAGQEVLSEADQLLQLGIRPENAPDCFTRDKGFDFSYVDSSGKSVVAKSIGDVPVLYRINAKCLPE